MPTDPTVAAKAKIAESLKALQSGELATNASTFFESLGYGSDKTHQLEPNTVAGLLELVNQPNFLNAAKAHAEEWKTVDFLFQLTDEEVRNYGQTSLEFDSTIDVRSDKHIESYIFFAVALKRDSYTRTELADITREINRLFPMPALVLFQHGLTLTLSIINRRIHKRDVARDVLEKVTLIKDINIKNPHRGHIEILYDLALPQLIGTYEVTNFVQLDEAWRNTLDTSVLNKRFYKELANWYFWALQHVEFPKQAGVSDEVNRATNVIRLITRLMFVWFLKERELVPEALFDRASLGDLLKDLSADKSTFYKAILQNLFFATLNTPMNDPNAPRVFRSETNGKRFNDQYMVHNQYRYQEIFSDPENALQIFAGIPFLNGGLFECLDKREEIEGKKVEIRIDGFSDVRTKQPKVPNKLFFGEEEQIDLNETYGTRGRRYTVRGLIDTLNRYKFTIAENTPIEEEVALDPELLGKVFENLLASYNPETGATARKQTGSFYTPREIVNYMVDESLIAYLETGLKSENEVADNLNERLRQLFAYTDEPHKFSLEEVDQLIAAIDAVKILDPACGSGAFPMGILQRLVFILSKLDPNNAKWEQRQIERVREAIRAAEKIEDHKFRENTLQDLKAQIANIEEAFARNELDYGRKLFLIENCIYGVDIQPIAIQIAKLRFFISLIIDQRIRTEADNLGIRPLPNLETKFIAANTLISLEKPSQSLLRNTAIDERERELKIVRQYYFTARTTRTKDKYRKEDERLRHEIGALLESEGNFPHATTEKLVAWNPYDQNASAEFFDVEWMFGVTDGFDVVIANPPYLSALEYAKCYPDHDRRELYGDYETARGAYDVYVLFYERGIELLKKHGYLIYISPNKLLSANYATALREFILKNATVRSLVDVSGIRVFKEASVYPVLLSLSAGKSSNYKIRLVLPRIREIEQFDAESFFFCDGDSEALTLLPENIWGFLLSDKFPLLRRIIEKSESLANLGSVNASSTAGEADQYGAYITEKRTDGSLRLINTGTIDRFATLWGTHPLTNAGERFLEPYLPLTRAGVNDRRKMMYRSPKIVFAKMARRCEGFLDESGEYASINTNCFYEPRPDVDIRYVAAFCNSKLFMFIYEQFFGALRMSGGYFQFQAPQLRVIPVRLPSESFLEPMVSLVNQIVTAKRDDPETDITILDRKVDDLFYELYELSPDDRAVIDASAQ